jgi:hypothetical protein
MRRCWLANVSAAVLGTLVLIVADVREAHADASEMDAGLLFYAPLDGAPTASIGAGGANPETCRDVQWVQGRFGQGAALTGTAELTYPGGENCNLKVGTVALWVKRDADWNDHQFWLFRAIQGPGWNHNSLFILTTEWKQLRTWVWNDQGEQQLVMSPNRMPYRGGQWYHLAVTYQDGTVKMYVDGQEISYGVACDPMWVMPSGHPKKVNFGGDGSAAQSVNGIIDELRIYDHPLTPDQVARLASFDPIKRQAADSVTQPGSTAASPAQPPSEFGPFADALLLYAPMNGSATAARAAGSGEPKPADGLRFVDGKFDKAVHLAGQARLYYSGIQNLELARGTLAAWVKRDKNWNEGSFVLFKAVAGGQWDRNSLYIMVTDHRELRTWVWDADHQQHMAMTPNGLACDAGQWYHLAVTFQDGDVHMYINGVEVQYATRLDADARMPQGHANNLQIGSDYTPKNVLDGEVDELRVYSRPLSAEEVKQLAQYTPPTNEPY